MTMPTYEESFPCAKCKTMTHIDDLDAKPEPRTGEYPGQFIVRAIWLWWQYVWFGRQDDSAWDDREGNTDWERFECRKCYGPGFETGREARGG